MSLEKAVKEFESCVSKMAKLKSSDLAVYHDCLVSAGAARANVATEMNKAVTESAEKYHENQAKKKSEPQDYSSEEHETALEN